MLFFFSGVGRLLLPLTPLLLPGTCLSEPQLSPAFLLLESRETYSWLGKVPHRNLQLSMLSCPQPFCRAPELVCGHNGETYSSVCAAYSDRVAVDYYGPCQAVGVLSEYSSVAECAAVKCPSLSATECKPIIPPGRLAVLGMGQGRDWADLLICLQRVSH